MRIVDKQFKWMEYLLKTSQNILKKNMWIIIVIVIVKKKMFYSFINSICVSIFSDTVNSKCENVINVINAKGSYFFFFFGQCSICTCTTDACRAYRNSINKKVWYIHIFNNYTDINFTI